MNQHTGYKRDQAVEQPPYLHPEYRSTVLRAPTRPLLPLPHTLSEITGPVYGHEKVGPMDHDLTRQHDGEPLGERIIVLGRVMDSDGRPLPDALMEIWQANSAGRYRHDIDNHPAPLDSQLQRRRPVHHRRGRAVSVRHHQARRVSVGQRRQRLAAGAHSLLALRHRLRHTADHADVFSGRSAARLRPDLQLDSGRTGEGTVGSPTGP